MWNGIDRRRFPRATYSCLITIRRRITSKSIATNTENIGAGGICVIIKDDLGLFQGVDLEINLEDGQPPVKCGGTVVWVVKKGDQKKKGGYLFDTGVEFIDIRPEDIDRIAAIVDKILDGSQKK